MGLFLQMLLALPVTIVIWYCGSIFSWVFPIVGPLVWILSSFLTIPISYLIALLIVNRFVRYWEGRDG